MIMDSLLKNKYSVIFEHKYIYLPTLKPPSSLAIYYFKIGSLYFIE